jgi:GrpB-like predicted nucleotidyltransferase (UPF0157 family)
VPPDAFHEALGVLFEAGYVPQSTRDAVDRHATLAAPHGAIPLTLQQIESGAARESWMRFRDALRADPALLARYNAIGIEAGPHGSTAYADAKTRFIADIA